MNTTGFATNAVNAQLLTSYLGGWTAKLKNNRQASEYLNRVESSIEMDYAAQVFCSRFSWEGEEIKKFPIGYIERTLFFSSMAVGFISNKYGFLILPANAVDFNIIGEPSQVLAQGYNEVFSLKAGQYALLKDNNTYGCPASVVERKSSLVADCTRTIETYLSGLKKPTIIVTNDKERVTNEMMAKQIKNNYPYILASRPNKGAASPEDDVPIFHNTDHNGSDLIALIQARKALTNDMLGKIGVDCNGAGKNQYQSEEELENETFFTNILNNQGLENRERFCHEVKDLFGLDLTVTNNVAEARADASLAQTGDEDHDSKN